MKNALLSGEIDIMAASSHTFISFYFDDATKPLSWRGTNDEMLGRNKEVCNLIFQRTGLKFKYGFTQDNKEAQLNTEHRIKK